MSRKFQTIEKLSKKMTAKTLDCGCMTWKPNCYSIPSMNEEKTVTFCTKHDPILNSVVNEAGKDVSLSDLEHLYKKAKHLEEVKKNYRKEYGAVLSAQRAELERKKAEKDFIENIRIQVINYASKGETMKLVIPKTLSETTVDKFLREQKTLATDMFITVECLRCGFEMYHQSGTEKLFNRLCSKCQKEKDDWEDKCDFR